MDRTPPIWLVANAASGSNSDAALDDLMARLAATGREPARVVRFPDDPLPARADLDREGVAMLAVFTGDGTVNAQCTRLYGWQGAVLVLPGGTQNLMAKALHGEDVSVEGVVAALEQGSLSSTRRRLIRCAQGDALCEIVAGPGAVWADVREEIRDGDLGGIATSLGEAIRRSASDPGVMIVEPATGREEGYPAIRLHPGATSMAVDAYGPQDIAGVAQQAGAILRRDFRTGPHDKLGEHDRVRCRSSEPIELMIDGERRTGSRDETFEIMDCDVNFLSSIRQHE
ncbi:diacylglycerol kinase family protein [Novosphingobium sp. EMRT-2]|uniref:diacylglycerol kinase family protein n=1 Tax=Novosphingobium sp. EMRT-2 TaxID=2571749 RepID=UPI0010BD43C5|nr:diacylglycerol kinase family protein [Novosphingobium sp. EMRT-2]QCI94542.1 diacylglycerol kinase [Novosphingobium sp. EMRT-2]